MKLKMKKHAVDFMFLLPALLLFCLIVVYPFLKGIRISLTDWDGFSPQYNFVGLENFRRILKDPSIKDPIKNSVFYTVVTVIIDNAAGLEWLCFQKSQQEQPVFQNLCVYAICFKPCAYRIIWKYIYSDIFMAFGIKSLLGNKKTVMWGICFMASWRDIGYAMLIYLGRFAGNSGNIL